MDNIIEKSWIEMSEKSSFKGRILKQFIKVTRNFLKDKDINKTRELWNLQGKRLELPKDIDLSRETMGDVECEWICPKNYKGRKILVYLHGGGYVLGSLLTARSFASSLAKYTGERVLSVGYRLAPEYPFPAALEDSLSVFHELLKKGFMANDIILIGDSAGGGLSLASALALKDIGEPLPGAVICLSPWTDLAATGESNRKNAKLDPIFGSGAGVIKAELYAGSESLYHPFVSPLYGEYDNFPPLLIHVGTEEVILDDSLRVAEKAAEAGAHVTLKIWKGMWHVFTAMDRMLPEARQSLKEIADFINDLD
jgi:acetyl esterase/lipase